jgi:hypothetical protein
MGPLAPIISFMICEELMNEVRVYECLPSYAEEILKWGESSRRCHLLREDEQSPIVATTHLPEQPTRDGLHDVDPPLGFVCQKI